jgi:4-amino-4-deoxy-L-arabinose transferase-like glycosyltransferase
MNAIKNNTQSGWQKWVVLGFLLLGITLPRLLDLNRFETIDEGLWLYRSANFYYALGQREFEHTYQSEHPGVTTTWAGTLGYLVEYPEYRGLGQGYMFNGIELHDFLQSTGKTEVDLLASGRRFMVLGITILLLITFWMIRKIIGSLPAIIGFLLIALEPFYIGLTNLLHLDGLLTGFMFLSSASLILYLWKDSKPVYLIISAAAGACSLLTKTPGVFMLLYTGLMLLVKHLVEKPRSLKRLLSRIALPLLIWTFVAIIVFILLWPAMWVEPLTTLNDIYGKTFGYIQGKPRYIFDAETQSLNKLDWRYYPSSFLWRNTPIVLVGLVFALIGFVRRWGIFSQDNVRQFVVSFFLFSFFFLMAIMFADYISDRYILPVYPPLTIISALGWVSISEKVQNWYKNREKHAAGRYVQIIILISIICLQLIEAIRVHPYYYAYYNPLLGDPEKVSENLLLGMGEGLDQVAAYLETQPNAEKLSVMSINAYGPLSYYFSGTTIQTPRRELTPEFLSDLDYVVTYVLQWQIQFQKPLLDAVENLEPEHTVKLNGLEYARVYNVMNISEMEWADLLQAQE